MSSPTPPLNNHKNHQTARSQNGLSGGFLFLIRKLFFCGPLRRAETALRTRKVPLQKHCFSLVYVPARFSTNSPRFSPEFTV